MAIFRSAVASLAVVALGYVAAHELTHGFSAWTAEDARRLEIALHPVPAPEVSVEGPGLAATTLRAWFAGERAATIVDFVYTRCDGVCSAFGSVFQQMQDDILRGDGTLQPVRLLSISFDPVHDDDAVLTRYAERLHANPRIWRFVHAAPGDATRELLQRFRVTVIPDGRGGWDHNTALLVVDDTGRLVRVFDNAEMDRALRFARSLSSTGDSTP
jgi:protein SCO1/2